MAALGTQASVVVARVLSSWGSRALEHRVSSCGTRAQLLHGMWDLPGPGLEPVSPALAGRFLPSAPPGKPLLGILKQHWFHFVDFQKAATSQRSLSMFCLPLPTSFISSLLSDSLRNPLSLSHLFLCADSGRDPALDSANAPEPCSAPPPDHTETVPLRVKRNW